ncbi:MAG: hypothetical protein HZB76_03595 [Chlamydiae bacterium]|nr:hypothetical protein [Chlamydiota bacterium]
MKNNVLLALVHVILLFLTFAVGVLFLCFPFAGSFSAHLAELILYKFQFFFYLGIVFLVMALILAFSFYSMHRKSFIRVKMNRLSYDVDVMVIEGYVKKYLKENYPKKKIGLEVFVLPKKKLEIALFVDTLKAVEKRHLLAKMEKEVGRLLFEYLSYTNDFFVTLNHK